MRLRHLLLSLGLSAPVLATAAATDFVAGWQAVMAHSPAYAASVAQAQAGQTKAEQGRALWRPQVLLNAGAGWASQRTQMDGAAFTAPGFGTSQDVGFRTQVDQGLGTAVTLMVQQPLLGGSRRANAEQLAAMARLAALQGQAERQALIWRLVDTHLQVLQAQAAGTIKQVGPERTVGRRTARPAGGGYRHRAEKHGRLGASDRRGRLRLGDEASAG